MRAVTRKIHRNARVAGRSLKFAFRYATQRSRALPNFIIIGAQKGGTTSLFYYLSQHPQIEPSFRKEIHFFDGGLDPTVDNFSKGIGWYRAHFPLKRSLGNSKITGEASPLYLFNPFAAKRIHAHVPDAKLIAVLRDPVERAISHYFHEERKQGNDAGLMNALLLEDHLIYKAISEANYKETAFIHRSYKSRGLYAQQLQRYMQYFPTAQLLILSSETFFADPTETIRRVCDFLQIDRDFVIRDATPKNAAGNKDRVPSDVRIYLQEYFRPHNEALYDIIENNFHW